jgi:hypothetical protein
MSVVSLYTIAVGISSNLDTSAVSLQEVAENVASEVISLLDLSTVSGNASFTYKVIDIPEAINGQGYTLRIQQSNLSWAIVASLDQYNSVRGEAKLFFSSFDSASPLRCQTEGGGADDYFIINSGGQTYKLWYGPILPSGTGKAPGSSFKPVVWCQIYIEDGIQKIRVGLGRLQVS